MRYYKCIGIVIYIVYSFTVDITLNFQCSILVIWTFESWKHTAVLCARDRCYCCHSDHRDNPYHIHTKIVNESESLCICLLPVYV